jgi:hypothetical protein
MIRKTIEMTAAFRFVLWRPILRVYMARAEIGQGKLSAAQETVSKGFAEIEQGCEGWALPELYRVRALILQEQGSPGEEIEACYRAAIDMARAQPNRIYELRAAFGLARRLAAVGRRGEAKEVLAGTISDDGLNLPNGKEAQKFLEHLS